MMGGNTLGSIDYLSGDCLQTTSDSWIARGIRFFSNMQTKKAWATHTACIISNIYCIEALAKSKITKLSRYAGPDKIVKIYRIPLTQEQRGKFADGAFDVANRAYGWTKLPLFALDAITTKILRFFGRKNPVFFFTRRFGVFSIPVCSQLYVYLLQKYCDYYLLDENEKKVSWRIVSPDYLDDLLNIPHNKAEIIFSQNVS